MSWAEIDLSTISTAITPIAANPDGYVFELLPGAKMSDYDPAKVEAQAAITEGEFAGRKLFFSFPDPAKQEWSPRILRRFVESLGLEPEPGESPVQLLNRGAGLRFKAPVKHRAVTEEGAPPKVDLDIFHVRPAV